MGRQVTACYACRALKIKCKIIDERQSCERCEARRLDCQIQRSSQAVADETNRWRAGMDDQMQRIQTAVNVLLRMSDLPPLSSYSGNSVHGSTPSPGDEERRSEEVDDSQPPAPIMGSVDPVDDKIYGLPIHSLYEVTRLPALRGDEKIASSHHKPTVQNDLVSRNLLPLATAQRFFELFTNRLNYFCYGIMCPHNDLESLRSSSTLLTTAICTVSAMHDPDGSVAFKTCYDEFQRLVASHMFSISLSIDDIRALIIGSYWLPSISSTLIGYTIQVAMRLRYHIAYFAAIKGSQQEAEKARLWYILYILDHYYSILYGHPPLISATEEPHQQWEVFISSTSFSADVTRIMNQVALYSIVAKVRERFGTYSSDRIPEPFLEQLGAYFSEVDRWFMAWANRMHHNDQVGWFPRDGAALHYHFARLHLCSYVFRGMVADTAVNASNQVKEYATVAVTSASSVLQLVLEREDLRLALVGMPTYMHGMITFAAVFLIKAAKSNFLGLTAVDQDQVFTLIQTFGREMRNQSAAPQHLVFHVSNGLDDLMRASLSRSDGQPTPLDSTSSGVPPAPVTMDSIFMFDTFDCFRFPLNSGVPMDAPMADDYQWANQLAQ